jgi:farnesyl-diphosphate farnesyltransferase
MTDVDDLLQKTSRTFAVTIPMLPAPTRHEVGVAYLVFRIVDTFEDGARWPSDQRIETIQQLLPLLDAPDPDRTQRFAERCAADPPVEHPGYVELLREIPFVLRQLDELQDGARKLIRFHAKRSAEGMAEVVSRTGPGSELRLGSLEELRQYCYVVAGIVGEMLTELFLLNRTNLAPAAAMMRERSHLFGEGLQLVNILKDAAADEREGRIYIPPTVDREAVMDLAQSDLAAASEYTLALQNHGAERGLLIFNALLVRFAIGTLAALREQRPSGKLTRAEVFAIVAAVLRDVDEGRPVLPGGDYTTQVPVAV